VIEFINSSENLPSKRLFVYSYKKGTHPFNVGPAPHGNSKKDTNSFCGTPKELLENLKQSLYTSDPKKVYIQQRVESTTQDILSRKCVRNLKQLQNLKYQINKISDPVNISLNY
jgi:hypothetical protein